MLASLWFTRQEAALSLLRPICSHLLFQAGLGLVEETETLSCAYSAWGKKSLLTAHVFVSDMSCL